MPKSLIPPFVSGALFAFGLSLSGMTRPSKVLGFLDVSGAWDPSLGFVMAGAILVYAPFFHWIKRRKTPLLEPVFHSPQTNKIDGRLLIGAALFGAGWGTAGFCPGPAVAAAATLTSPALIFCGSMLLGMQVFQIWTTRKAHQ